MLKLLIMKKQLRLKVQHGALRPGVYWFAPRLGSYLVSKGKAVPVESKPAKKEEKTVIETKEEKFQPETKDFSQVPISKLDVANMTDGELQGIIDGDERVTAVRMAKKELDSR